MNPLVHRTVLAMAHFTRYLGGGFKYCLCSPLCGPFQPPTRICHQVLQGRDPRERTHVGRPAFFSGESNIHFECLFLYRNWGNDPV